MAGFGKTIDDLPHFRVSGARQSQTRETDFELSGMFDRTAGVNEDTCSLLLPGKDVLIALRGELRFLDRAAGTASFQTSDESMPETVGSNLTYVHKNWEPYHVWMVADPRWKWNRTLFHAIDAISRVVEEGSVSVVDGEEVRKWIEIKPLGKKSSLSRFYPVFPSGRTTLPPIPSDGVIKGGWSHAHCELCKDHVDAEHYGYIDLGDHWICETCHGRYVSTHDLSFMQ